MTSDLVAAVIRVLLSLVPSVAKSLEGGTKEETATLLMAAGLEASDAAAKLRIRDRAGHDIDTDLVLAIRCEDFGVLLAKAGYPDTANLLTDLAGTLRAHKVSQSV